MVTLLIISIILFVSYIGYTVGMYGIPASISDTYYRLGKRGWLFTLFCLAESSLLVASFIEASIAIPGVYCKRIIGVCRLGSLVQGGL